MILNSGLSCDLLIDAYKFYQRRDAVARDALKVINQRNDLENAVLGCLEEAKRLSDPKKQALYLQAACFGRRTYPGVAVDKIQYTRLIRVLSVCRPHNLDIDLDDSPDVIVNSIVDQFIERKQFSIAIWVINWMKADGIERVLERWSEYMMTRPLRDETVALRLQEMLGPNPVISYAKIASKAIEYNRSGLAIKLIEKENQSSKQIPLLLALKQHDMVLAQALCTHDSNLIYMAIFKLEDSIRGDKQFLELLKKHPQALRYYCNYLTHCDISTAIMISHSRNSDDELSLCLMDNRMDSALTVSKRAKQEIVYSLLETHTRRVKLQLSLLQQCGKPAKSKKNDWTGLSISDSIINLIAIGQVARARDFQRRFEVTDRKYKVLEQIALDTLPKLVVNNQP